jgi:hypothetical protein
VAMGLRWPIGENGPPQMMVHVSLRAFKLLQTRTCFVLKAHIRCCKNKQQISFVAFVAFLLQECVQNVANFNTDFTDSRTNWYIKSASLASY